MEHLYKMQDILNKTYVLASAFPSASVAHAYAKHRGAWPAPLPPSPWPVWHPVPRLNSTAPSNHGERHKQTAAQAPELNLKLKH